MIESGADVGELGLSIQRVEGKYNRIQEAIGESMKHGEAVDVKKNKRELDRKKKSSLMRFDSTKQWEGGRRGVEALVSSPRSRKRCTINLRVS
jgi:hypothetical protein